MRKTRTAFAMFISPMNDSANQYTGIRKKEKGMRRSCIVERLINLQIIVSKIHPAQRYCGKARRISQYIASCIFSALKGDAQTRK
jgi:hypothetical protein